MEGLIGLYLGGAKTNIAHASTVGVMDAMTLERLVTKYVRQTEGVLRQIQLHEVSMVLQEEGVRLVIDSARRYLEDARFFLKRG